MARLATAFRKGERDKAVEMRCNHMAFGVSSKAGRQVALEIDLFLKEIEGPESRH